MWVRVRADGREANPVAGIEVVQSPRVCETAVTNRNDHHSQVAEEDRTQVVGRRRDPVVALPFLGRVVMLLQTATPSVSSGAPLTIKR